MIIVYDPFGCNYAFKTWLRSINIKTFQSFPLILLNPVHWVSYIQWLKTVIVTVCNNFAILLHLKCLLRRWGAGL